MLAYGVSRRKLLVWWSAFALLTGWQAYLVAELWIRRGPGRGPLPSLRVGTALAEIALVWGRWGYAQGKRFHE